MTDELIYDTWNGLTFGSDGTGEVYPLIQSPGLWDLSFSATTLGGGASDGAAVTPQWADERTWTTVVEVRDTNPDAWTGKRDGLMAATSMASNRLAELPYVQHRRGEERTVFARVTSRKIARDGDAEVFGLAEAQITYAAMDPTVYGPEIDVTFADGNDSQTADGGTSPGWAPSWRWELVIPGPVTNPTISSGIASSAAIRYRGSVASGSNLVIRNMPRGVGPRYTKVVTDAELAGDWTVFGVGTEAYGNLDGGPGSNRPPQFFPISDGDVLTLSSTSGGSAGASLTWRPGFD